MFFKHDSIAQCRGRLELCIHGNSQEACHSLWSQCYHMNLSGSYELVVYTRVYAHALFFSLSQAMSLNFPLQPTKLLCLPPFCLSTHLRYLCHWSFCFPEPLASGPSFYFYEGRNHEHEAQHLEQFNMDSNQENEPVQFSAEEIPFEVHICGP